MEKKRNTFSGSLGFVLAAAGSAVGLGNIWRFPYLAAKDGGGLFLVIYLILALTFGYTLLVTEVSIGRKTKQSPLTAYKKLNKKWGFLGIIASLVPVIIFPYYITIGGWVVKYFLAFLTGKGTEAAQDGYFTGFITSDIEPVILMLIFLAVTAFIVFRGVNKGIESFSKIIMPLLKPAIVTVIIIKGVGFYNDFYTPYLYTPKPALQTISTALFAFKGPYGARWEVICAGAIITMIPTLIIFLLLQKQIYSGMTQGAVKE